MQLPFMSRPSVESSWYMMTHNKRSHTEKHTLFTSALVPMGVSGVVVRQVIKTFTLQTRTGKVGTVQVRKGCACVKQRNWAKCQLYLGVEVLVRFLCNSLPHLHPLPHTHTPSPNCSSLYSTCHKTRRSFAIVSRELASC